MRISEKTIEYINKKDILLNQKKGYVAYDLRNYVTELVNSGKVEVGHRESCGHTDLTLIVFREWQIVLKKLEIDGFVIKSENVKHKNSWATKSGGFWQSIIYTLENKEELQNE